MSDKVENFTIIAKSPDTGITIGSIVLDSTITGMIKFSCQTYLRTTVHIDELIKTLEQARPMVARYDLGTIDVEIEKKKALFDQREKDYVDARTVLNEVTTRRVRLLEEFGLYIPATET